MMKLGFKGLKNVAPVIAMALLISISTMPAWANAPLATSPLRISTGSQKVPSGTMLTIAFQTPMDSKVTATGTPFMATLQEDFYTLGTEAERRVVLPKGTAIRGRAMAVSPPKWLGRGGSIALTFDHVVLATGDLLPLTLNLSAENDQVKRIKTDRSGNTAVALYDDPGLGVKINRGFEKGAETVQNITKAGVDAGKGIAGGAGVIVTAPVAAIGGVVAGGAVTAGKGLQAVFGRGESTVIAPGDSVNIDFGGAFNLPTD